MEDQEFSCTDIHVTSLAESTDADGDGIMEDSEWQDLGTEWDALFGNPLEACSDNVGDCQQLVIEQQYQLIAEHCGTARAKRRYRAIDWNGEGNRSNWVEQNITIIYESEWKVTVPADIEVVCVIGEENSLPTPSKDDIVIQSGTCDQLGVEVEVQSFVGSQGACKKYEVTYHIINWCLYEAGMEPVAIDRVDNHKGEVEEEVMVAAEDYPDAAYLTYTRYINLVDNIAPELTIDVPNLCINGADPCHETVTWKAWASDCVHEEDLTVTATVYETDADGNILATVASEVAYNFNDGTWNISANVENKKYYVAEYWAADNCGNSGGAKVGPDRAWDCKQPTPYAISGISVSLMRTGMVEVWASDFDNGSFDNCDGDVELRVVKAGDEPITTSAEASALSSSIIFDCTTLGTQFVELYVIDDEGNYDFVTTYAIVQDHLEACTGTSNASVSQVGGSILNAVGVSVEEVAVSVNGNMASMSTEDNGAYTFTLPSGEDYTITPEKDVNPLNGVSTFDLVLISKHILGIDPFDAPYKYIAADVNKSGSITAFDMVQLRQLILNITTEFPNNTSWRFVDAAHQFGTNPLAENFNEFISINDLAGSMTEVNFIAVKVGDVNGNAQPNSLVSADVRTAGTTLTLETADQFVEAGQQVSVAFTAADIANVSGYQFTMNYAGLAFAQLGEGVATAENFNTNLRGAIATSWNGAATANDVLFTLNFKATTAGNLSELLSVSSDAIAAEAYTATGEVMDVEINFTTSEATAFGLEQNTPNPFNGETVIGFTLPQAGQATLKVMDVQGKVIKSLTNDYAKGYNQISINAKELGATGVLHYQLESADNVATKKMIIIE